MPTEPNQEWCHQAPFAKSGVEISQQLIARHCNLPIDFLPSRRLWTVHKMGLISDIEHDQRITKAEESSTRTTAELDDPTPVYYNSEPSSQPPRYPSQNTQDQQKSTASASAPLANKPPNRHRDSAPASTIHAISPYVDLDAERRAERKDKSLGQRLKGFINRNFRDGYEDPDGQNRVGGSAPKLNVFGAGLKGGGMVSPYERKARK